MPLLPEAKELMLNTLVDTGGIDQVSLHNGDPGSTGANEITGGGYGRASVTSANWNAASVDEISLNANIAFDGPAEQAVTHAGVWIDGVFAGVGALTGDTAFNAAGEYNLDEATTIQLLDPA